jgi:hypothetical protein
MSSSIGSYQQDTVVLLDSVPSPTADAPEPFVVANERRVVVAYRIAESGRSVRVMTRSVSCCFWGRPFIGSGH